MKRIFTLLIVPVFLFTVFFFSPSASASDEVNYYSVQLDSYRNGMSGNSSRDIHMVNVSMDLLNTCNRVVIVGYFPEGITLEGYTLVSFSGYFSVYVRDVQYFSSLDFSTIRVSNTSSSSSAFMISYVYLEFANPSYSISSARYNDNVSGLGSSPSVLPSFLSNVSFPNYWTNFSTLQLVLNKNDVAGSSYIEIPLTLSGFSSPSSYVPEVNCQVYSGGLPVSFSLSLDPVRESSEEVGYGILSLNGPFSDDIIITLTLGDVFSFSDTFTLHINKPVCYLNPVLSEQQLLKSINELLGSNFSSINSLLGQLNSGISTSNSWLSSIWTAISNGFSSVGNWFSTTWNNLITGFNSVVTSITTGAQDVVDALWELLGPVEPSDPPFSDSVGDLGALEDGILTDTDIGRQDFSNISGSAMSSIVGLSAAFYGASFLLTYFLELPFINTLLVLSLSLGVFAAFTGIVMSFRSAAERRPNRSQQRSNGNNKSSGG